MTDKTSPSRLSAPVRPHTALHRLIGYAESLALLKAKDGWVSIPEAWALGLKSHVEKARAELDRLSQ